MVWKVTRKTAMIAERPSVPLLDSFYQSVFVLYPLYSQDVDGINLSTDIFIVSLPAH